jgi:hypothetical protein
MKRKLYLASGLDPHTPVERFWVRILIWPNTCMQKLSKNLQATSKL